MSIDVTPAATSDVPGGVRIEGLPDHVVIRQLYLGCLSQASYLVGDASSGRAIVVDPRRDTEEILAVAAEDELAIELVAETHFHADFLSGHLELAAATGAPIGIGEAGTTDFPSRPLADGEVIDLGRVQVEVLATPGHTPESISLVVRPDAGADPVAVLTGDTLFIGDVGRPDLLVAAGRTASEMGALLHGSLRRLLELPDDALVLPAHGAGSACGKALSSETVSTIGEQRRTNYALQPMTQDDLIALVTEGQSEPPAYFSHDARLNRQDHPLLAAARAVPALDREGLAAARAAGARVIDTRPNDEFAAGHLAGSINVGLGGRFAEQVGAVADPDTPLVIAGGAEAAAEAQLRLGRIGFDHVVGAVLDPAAAVAADPEGAARLSRLTATELAERRTALGDDLQLIDVRGPGEVVAAPVEGARNIPLPVLRRHLDDLDRARPVVLVCAGGARSATASSLLRANGFGDVSDVLGGAAALGAGGTCRTSGRS
jgi:glyoxylase-like metal-dependent hydrolase (beta-lactamase superfamily II)/rhodanese-related sulfurtransferase